MACVHKRLARRAMAAELQLRIRTARGESAVAPAAVLDPNQALVLAGERTVTRAHRPHAGSLTVEEPRPAEIAGNYVTGLRTTNDAYSVAAMHNLLSNRERLGRPGTVTTTKRSTP
jgi:hypothetical protein